MPEKLRDRVLAALGGVYDPELDEPITSLGFVSSCRVDDAGGVAVRLRLPTPQCAPNFAFLMAADARLAASRVQGVERVEVELEDHYTAAEINPAVNRGEGFGGAFPGESESADLEGLREIFTRKALLARQAAVFEGLLDEGAEAGEVVRLRLAALPDSPEARRCVQLRQQLGLTTSADSPAFVGPNGAPITPGEVERWLRMASLVRTGLEANGGICRSLLAARGGRVDQLEEVGA